MSEGGGEDLLWKYSRTEKLWGGEYWCTGSDINDINGCHNGAGRERDGEGQYDIEEMVGFLDV